MDAVTGPVSRTHGLAIGTMPDELMLQFFDLDRRAVFHNWELRSEELDVINDIERDAKVNDFRAGRPTSFLLILGIHPASPKRIPIWIPVAITGLAAVASWRNWSWHFSLRTLLVAITLVAVAMGLLVWSTRI